MSRREDIDTGIYSDPDFTRLSPIARSVYIWSWTNTHCGMSGVYKIDRRLMGFETGWAEDELAAALDELQEHEMLFYDGRVVYVKARVKRLRTKSPNVATSVVRDLEGVGLDHPFVVAFIDRYRHLPWLEDAFAKASIGTLQGTVHETPSEPLIDPLEGRQTLQGKGKGKGKEGGAGETSRTKPQPPDPDEIPADLAEHLRPVVPAVVAVLSRIAAAKGAKPVTVAATARAIAGHPGHDHLAVAQDVEHWWVHGLGAQKPVKDVVATYRNRLSSLPAVGAPTGGVVVQHPTAGAPTAAEHIARLKAAQHGLKAASTPIPDGAA